MYVCIFCIYVYIFVGIACPVGMYKLSRAEVETNCEMLEYPCPEKYTCLCKPCKRGSEVDITPQVPRTLHYSQTSRYARYATYSRTQDITPQVVDIRRVQRKEPHSTSENFTTSISFHEFRMGGGGGGPPGRPGRPFPAVKWTYVGLG
jgi:hypothetical protein